MSTLKAILSMGSGECRWVGRYDVHVYCRRPRGVEPTYCVVCPDAGLEHGHWTSADCAANTIDYLLSKRGAA
jgi:hypothetical protein